jgi:K+/H+ antiporter YhaU regulatory subunit KhtT
LEGKAIEQVKSYQEIGVIVVGLRNHGAEMIFNPPGNHVLKAHDTIVSLGSREQLDRLEAACKSGKITN